VRAVADEDRSDARDESTQRRRPCPIRLDISSVDRQSFTSGRAARAYRATHERRIQQFDRYGLRCGRLRQRRDVDQQFGERAFCRTEAVRPNLIEIDFVAPPVAGHPIRIADWGHPSRWERYVRIRERGPSRREGVEAATGRRHVPEPHADANAARRQPKSQRACGG